MRLTNALFRGKYKFVKGIPGNIWIGKHRFVPPIDKKERTQMWKKMMYEEEVMMYLKNPYLTEEQEKLWLEKYPEPIEKAFPVEDPKLVPLKNRTFAHHFGRLNIHWGEHDFHDEVKKA